MSSSILLLAMSLFIFAHATSPRSFLRRGFSVLIEDELEILVSPKKTFTCGFYGSGGNAYYFSIWFTGSRDRTVVWMANRDKPVNGKGSRLTFRGNGVVVLTDVDGTVAWETNTTSTSARKAELLESGNLILKDPSGHVLWQSFDNPTDTLLPNQPFTKSLKLISSFGRGSYYSGYFNFYFDSDNVLKLMHDGPVISSLYWPNPDSDAFGNGRTTYNSTRIAVLDDSGMFMSSDRFQFNASDRGHGIKRRLTINHDGNLRLYSLNESNGTWAVTWEALKGMCKVHGVCGRNGICVYTPEPKCSCPPGYQMNDPTNWNSGCKPKFNVTCSNFTSDKVRFVELPQTDYYGFDLVYNSSTSYEWCQEACLTDCNCLGFAYRTNGLGPCFTKSSLFNGYKTPDFPGNLYLKLPVSLQVSSVTPILNGSLPICPLGENTVLVGSSSMYDGIGKRIRWAYLYWFASVIGAVEILFFMSGWWILFRKQGGPDPLEDGYQALSSQFKKFSHGELKIATRNFREEIGRGGSGTVYKGNLGDGREVAVKRLGDVHHGEDFFWAEVSTIGKINHMNLARMWGFCAEGRNRLLVYEFVKNQSLDRHLFGPNLLRWKDRFRISLGTAKGLAYLHHECLEWIIHCDVKPENILLDPDFEPKIADFGLAKLLQRGNATSDFSMIRGTKGYMAPEWALNLPITAKVDVFSYGVMVLEMVRGIRLSNWAIMDVVEGEEEVEEAQLTKFVRVVRRNIQFDPEDNTWIEKVLDPRLRGQYSKRQARALVEVGIACVEEDRTKRPTMDNIVDVLLKCDNEPNVPAR
ncbi:putative receptor protein kinase ZmPK1 [Punica granatum]|uniref:Receptor-like serine/threonine-protein kinase n=2 Tax=Punica granatum TaxID=22663 RepID=A0A6P8BXR8_PUNGR|nr:putative receptor protein kinase ZmPK1 [Punica granatum]